MEQQTKSMFDTTDMIEQMQGRKLDPLEKSAIWVAYSMARAHAEIERGAAGDKPYQVTVHKWPHPDGSTTVELRDPNGEIPDHTLEIVVTGTPYPGIAATKFVDRITLSVMMEQFLAGLQQTPPDTWPTQISAIIEGLRQGPDEIKLDE